MVLRTHCFWDNCLKFSIVHVLIEFSPAGLPAAKCVLPLGMGSQPAVPWLLHAPAAPPAPQGWRPALDASPHPGRIPSGHADGRLSHGELPLPRDAPRAIPARCYAHALSVWRGYAPHAGRSSWGLPLTHGVSACWVQPNGLQPPDGCRHATAVSAAHAAAAAAPNAAARGASWCKQSPPPRRQRGGGRPTPILPPAAAAAWWAPAAAVC